LPLVFEANLTAFQTRGTQPETLQRFDEVAQLLTGKTNTQARDGILWLKELVDALNIPPAAAYGIQKSDFPEIIVQAKKASSMKGNPIELNDVELAEILEQAV
jgi:alcohol dehydrogenase class IV